MKFLYSIVWLTLLIDTRCPRAQTSSLKFEEEPESIVKDIEHGSGETVSVTLACRINGVLATHTVEWWKNGKRISINGSILPGHNIDGRYSPRSNGSNYDLEIVPIAEYNAWKDEGRYQCRVFDEASNSILLNSRIATVTIRRLPRAGHPVCEIDQATVIEGEEVNIICWSDQGVPVVGLKYFRNGKELMDCSSRLTNDGKVIHSCEFTVSKDDIDAEFVCMMVHTDSDSPTNKRCTPGKLNILHKPTVSLQPDTYTMTGVEDVVKFTCNARGNPRPKHPTFFYNGREIDENDARLHVEDDGWTVAVQVSTFSETDNGAHVVSCTVSNHLGYDFAIAELGVNITAVNMPTEGTISGDRWTFPITAVALACMCIVIGIFVGVCVSILLFKVRFKSKPTSSNTSRTSRSPDVINGTQEMNADILEREGIGLQDVDRYVQMPYLHQTSISDLG